MGKAMAVLACQQQRYGVAIATQCNRKEASGAKRRLKQQHELAGAGRKRRPHA